MIRFAFPTAAALLLLAACGDAPPDPRGVAAGETLLRTSGTARAETRPDEARFTAGVNTIASTGPEASAANARKMAAVVAAIRAAGVAERDIQTQQLSVSRNEYGPNRNRFEASNVVAVRVRKLDSASAVIGAAMGAGANVLSGPELRVGDPEAATRDAYARALRSARLRADAYAAAADLHVARVISIRDTFDEGYQPMRAFEADMVAPRPVSAQVAPPVMAGTSEQDVRVVAEFALEPK